MSIQADLEDLSLAQRLALLPPEQRADVMTGIDPEQFLYDWSSWRRKSQTPPDGNWSTWLLMAGRGAGKTRTASEWIHERVRNNLAKRILLLGRTAADVRDVMIHGNALALDTRIPTPTGWTTMGAVQAGDTIIGGNGKPCQVEEAFDILSGRTCYRLTFKSGATVVADADHKWVTWDKAARKKRSAGKVKVEGAVHTTTEIAQSFWSGGQVNHAVDVVGAHYDQRGEIPIDPYMLGVWLGAGDEKSAGIHLEGEDADQILTQAGKYYEIVPRTYSDGRTGGWTVDRLKPLLKDAGLLQGKHIPVRYLRMIGSHRLALLQGIMDTAGSVDVTGGCQITVPNVKLRDEVVELLASLRIVATDATIAPLSKASLRVSKGEQLYRVLFRTTVPVTTIERYLDRLAWNSDEIHGYDYITAIDKVRSVPVRCIRVDSPDHCFMVTNRYIPTHNSGLLNTGRPEDRPEYFPSKRLVVWPNGAEALLLSADEPDQARGPQADTAWCIAAGEDVLSRRGWVPIDDVRVGDEVMTRQDWKRVDATRAMGIKPVIRITTATGTLRCTPDHKIWSARRGWTHAGELAVGETLYGPDRIGAAVVSIDVDGTAPVYDLTVHDAHEFYANGILTHNCIAKGQRVRTEQGLVPIENIKAGELVWTRGGLRSVRMVHNQGVKPVVRVITSAGELRCTSDHKIWVETRGWVEAGSLETGAILCQWSDKMIQSQDHRTTSNGAVSVGTTALKTTTTETPAATFSMSLSGNQSTGNDRMVRHGYSTSITSTTTSPITQSETLSSGHDRNTSSITTSEFLIRRSPVKLLSALRKLGRGSRRHRDRAPSAVTSFLARPPVQNTAQRSVLAKAGDSVKPKRSSALRAAKSSRRSEESRPRPNTVPVNVFMRDGLTHAQSAVKSLRAFGSGIAIVPMTADEPVRVLCVVPDGSTQTYDLTVEEHHEFFTEDVLTKNCDEFASFPGVTGSDGATAFDNLRLGLRLPVPGDQPRMILTTTPRRTKAMFDLLEQAKDPKFGIVITRGSTYENLGNLADSFKATIIGLYEGTRLGRQELMGEMLTDIEGALFMQEWFDMHRVVELPSTRMYAVVGVDPSVAERPTDECGIVVVKASMEKDFYRRHVYICEDASVKGSPDIWSARVAAMSRKWNAPIVAEGNQGGELVRMAIAQADSNLPVHIVHAKSGKATRAEPIAAALQQGRIHMVGWHPELEDQMCSWIPAESRYSPDRLDAAVWGCLSVLTKQKGVSFALGRHLRARSSRGRLPSLNSALFAAKSGSGRR